MRRILHVFHGRHSAASGAFGTAPLDVRGFTGADVSVWRGKSSAAFGVTFEESSDQVSWSLCAGADADRDPGADTEDTFRLLFRKDFLHVVGLAEGLASLWAIGSFDPNPPFDGAPPGVETASVDVGGRANNLVLLEDSGSLYLFASLGQDGIAVVRIDDPTRRDGLVHLATIDNTTLGALAGDSSEALAIVDGFLVSVAIGPGKVDGSGHGVTVFNAPAAIAVAEGGAPFDFSTARITRTGANVIAAPGNGDDKGGGVAGAAGRFFVATGNAELAVANITVGAPTTYEVDDPVDLSSDMSHVVDVVATATHAIVSGQKTGSVDHAVRTIDMDPTPSANALVDVPGRFRQQGDRSYTGPGNFACDLCFDEENDVLYVGAIDQIARYNLSEIDSVAAMAPVPDAGVHLIGVAGDGGVLIAAGDFELRTYRGSATGFRSETRTRFGAPNQILAAARVTTVVGNFMAIAAGWGGIRMLPLR